MSNPNELCESLRDALRWLDGMTNPASPIYIRGAFSEAAEDGIRVTIARGQNALKKAERISNGGSRIATIGNEKLSDAIESCDMAIVDVARAGQMVCDTARETSETITFVETDALRDLKKACKDWKEASNEVLRIIHESGRIAQS